MKYKESMQNINWEEGLPIACLLVLFFVIVSCSGRKSAGTANNPSADEAQLNALADSISTCLDDPSTYAMADSLLQQAFAIPGLEKSDAWPIFLYHQGIYHFYTGDMKQAKLIFLRLNAMLPLSLQANLNISVPQTLGVIYRRESQTDSALYYYDHSLQAAIELGEDEWLGMCYMNVGTLYNTIGQHDQAQRFLDKAVFHAMKSDDGYTQLAAQQLRAGNEVVLGKKKEAEKDIRQAYLLAQEAESADWQLRCISTFVTIFNHEQNPDSAARYVSIGTELLPQLPSEGVTAIGFLFSRANHYYNTGQWQLAVADFRRITAASKATCESDVLLRLAQSYEHLGNYAEALHYMDAARQRTDSIASVRISAQLADFNVKYQTLEKDLKIAHLTTLSLWLTIGLLAFLLAAVTFWLWLRGRRYRQEAQIRIDTLEKERSRLAKELHDGVCNDLLALEIQCATGIEADQLQQSLNRLRSQTRDLSHQLMPPEFSHLTLPQLLAHHAQLISKNAALAMTFYAEPDADDDTWQRLSSEQSHELYRIVQEHAANILKGGTATRLEVRLRQFSDGTHQLTLCDDGKPSQETSAAGIGNRTFVDRITNMGAHAVTTTSDTETLLDIHF